MVDTDVSIGTLEGSSETDIHAVVVFNRFWSTEEEQKLLHQLLPVAHEYGDRQALLETGQTLVGKTGHDAYCEPALRVKTRKRCTLLPIVATHMGQNISRSMLQRPLSVLTCFCATPDWHASGLDAEEMFLRPVEATSVVPRIGPYSFQFSNYMYSVYEDLVMCLTAIKAYIWPMVVSSKRKAHIKLVPLAVGMSIRTRYGEFLGPLLIPAYLTAVQYACNTFLDDSWVETLEFVDHAYGQLTPVLALRHIRIFSSSVRDAFDFSGATGIPILIAPCDAFSKVGGSPSDKTLASTLAANSDLSARISKSQYQFVSWPFEGRTNISATQQQQPAYSTSLQQQQPTYSQKVQNK